jgi:hypothetical protein
MSTAAQWQPERESAIAAVALKEYKHTRDDGQLGWNM